VRTDELADPERSAALQTLTEASIRAVRYIIANPDEAAEIMHEHVPELDVEYLKGVMSDLNSEHVWGVDGGLDPKVEEFTADLNVKLGILTTAPAPKDVLDPRYVDVALKKLGLYEQK
jgi:ABC-type nitrate/sulfonate/bicarbonate transport system substrate-binding protein